MLGMRNFLWRFFASGQGLSWSQKRSDKRVLETRTCLTIMVGLALWPPFANGQTVPPAVGSVPGPPGAAPGAPGTPIPGVIGAAPPPGGLTIQTLLTESLEHDSNLVLAPTNVRSVNGSVTSPQLIVTSDTPSAHFDTNTTVNLNEFDLPHYSSTDVHSQLHLSDKTAFWSAQLGSTFDYDTTRTSEQTTSGENVAGIRHTAITVSPQVGYYVSPIDQLVLAATATGARYGSQTIYTNYDNFSLTPTYNHIFDPADIATVSLVANRFETVQNSKVTFNDYGASAAWQKYFSPTFNGSIGLGGIKREGTVDATAVNPLVSTGIVDFTVTANVALTLQQDIVTLLTTREPAPISVKTEAEVTKFVFSETHFVTPRLELDLNTTLQYSDYPHNLPSYYLQKRYISANVMALYHLTSVASVSLSYTYRNQHTANGSAETINSYAPENSNNFMISVSFSPYPEVM